VGFVFLVFNAHSIGWLTGFRVLAVSVRILTAEPFWQLVCA
jgi:hypothetical protein